MNTCKRHNSARVRTSVRYCLIKTAIVFNHISFGCNSSDDVFVKKLLLWLKSGFKGFIREMV